MESRVDATLRHNGLKNFDFAVFKKNDLRGEGRA
jgi:hypothetical protein